MKKPNIVIFNPDSYRGDVVGHLGNPAAHTPNLDRFVAEDAVSFRNAFCQNPVCTPSRCSFMTGWYPHTRGHRTMSHMLHPERGETNLLRELKNNGYHVWWGGKNDLIPGQDGPWEHCDEFFRPTEEDYKRWGIEPFELLPESTWRGEPDSDTYYSFMRGLIPDCEGVRVDVDVARVRGALEFIERYDGDKPFCIFLPISAPHPQYAIEKLFYDQIDPAKIQDRIPGTAHEGPEPSMRTRLRERQNLEPTWTDARWNALRRVYYAMCARVDHFFGEVVDTLKSKSHYDDSAVFFFSDHGDFTGDFGLVEKSQNTFEECMVRVPLAIKPPKGVSIQPGIRDALVELIDFTATAYELAGIEPDYTHFGISLLPLLASDANDALRDAVFCEGGRMENELHCSEGGSNPDLDPENKYWPKQYTQQSIPEHTKAAMVRTNEFKYIHRYYEDDQLYDLRCDPQELHNRIHDPECSQIVADLRNRLLDWYMATADVVPFEGDGRGVEV